MTKPPSPPHHVASAFDQSALAAVAKNWNLDAPPATVALLLSYGELLLQWNSRINLTGAPSLEKLITDHFADSFAIAAQLARLPVPLTVVDVGSGGGLPAIPLAILDARLTIQMIEPIAKKAAFLRTAVRTLGLANRMHLAVARLEAFRSEQPTLFDVAISRATFHPTDWLKAALPIVRPGGYAFALATGASVDVPPGWLPAKELAYAGGRRWLHQLERSA